MAAAIDCKNSESVVKAFAEVAGVVGYQTAKEVEVGGDRRRIEEWESRGKVNRGEEVMGVKSFNAEPQSGLQAKATEA